MIKLQSMELDRTKNALRNIVWGVIEKITLLLLPFITRTVLIKVLGVDYLGLNTLFVSILQVLSVSELGIGSAIVFSMYKPIAEDDNKTLCALLNLYKKIYHCVGSAILILGLLIMPFLHHFVKGEIPSDVNLYSLYLIFLLNTVISYFLFAYKETMYRANGMRRYHFSAIYCKSDCFLPFTIIMLMFLSFRSEQSLQTL